MRMRLAVTLLSLAVASCGGKVQGPGGGGGGGSGSAGSSSGGPVGGDLPPGQTGTGGGPAPSGGSSPGNPGGPGPSCTMSGGEGAASDDGGCDSVTEYATCGGTQYQVDCRCFSGGATCRCTKNGQPGDEFAQLGGCTGCSLPEGVWMACGFP